MKLLNKLSFITNPRVITYENSKSDQEAESFMSNEYFGLLRISGLYLKMDGCHWLFSLLQIIFAISVLLFNLIVIMQSSFSFVKINIVIFGESIHFCLLTQLEVIIIIYIQTKRKQFVGFHKEMAINFFDYAEPYEGVKNKLQEEMKREKKLLVPIPLTVIIAAGGVLLIAPIVDQYGTFDFNKISSFVNIHLPFPFAKYPYQAEEGILYYITVSLQLLLGFFVSSTIATGGFLYIVMSQNLSMQMEILIDSLENIEKRTMLLTEALRTHVTGSTRKLYNIKEFAFCYNICLKKNFQHHQIIMRNYHFWKEIFSVPILLAYITGTIVIALSLLSISSWKELPGTTFSALVLCVAEVGYMFLFSVYGQRMTDLNEKLRFKIYCIKWYYCDESVKRSITIFQEMTLRPMILLAGGIVPVNMDTFAKVMNSAYSYYNLVNAFNIA